MSTDAHPPIHKHRQCKLEIELSDSVFSNLVLIHRSGLYGKTVEEAAERIICEGLRQLYLNESKTFAL